MQLPVPSFVDRPVPYFTFYLFVLLSASLWPANFSQSNQVVWEPGGGLRFTPPATAYTTAPPAKLAALSEWTILMDAKVLPPLKQGRILSYSLGNRQYNLYVEQLWSGLSIWVRTIRDQRSREIHADTLFDPTGERRFQLALTYNRQELSLYIDGERKSSFRIGNIDSSWDGSFPLVFASHPDGKFTWNGVIYNVTILDHAVTQEKLKDPGILFTDTPAVLRYFFHDPKGPTVFDLGTIPSAPVTIPQKFVPYKRTVLQSPRDYWPDPGRPHIRDIFANIVIYLPIGYLLSILVARNGSALTPIVVPAIVGMGISFAIEILQAFLPTRNSSTVDMMTNTAGTLLGVYMKRKGWIELVLKTMNVSFRGQTPLTMPPPLPKT